MHAHLTRWQRFQVKGMAYAIWSLLALAVISTTIFGVLCLPDRRRTR